MRLARRSFLALALATGGVLAARAGSAIAGDSLRVATFKGGDALLVKSAGLDATPYRLDYAEFGSGNLIVEALHAKAIDLGSMSEIPAVFAAASGAEIKAVAVLHGDVNQQVVLVPKDSPIRSIAELKGKRIGYVRATTTHYYLLKMLEEVGLGFDDITAINLSPQDGRAAFDSGRLDAWAIYGYSVPFTIQQSGARVLKTALGYLSGNYLISVRTAVLTDPALRAAAGDYLSRLQDSYAWQNAHPKEWAAALSKAISVPAAIIEAILAEASAPYRLAPIDDAAILSSQQVADIFAKAGLIPHPVDLTPIFDRSFTQALQRSPS